MLRIAGITDEVTTCECCGRCGLKRTVVLESDAGVKFFGTDCAAKALGHKKAVVEMTARGVEFCRRWLNATPKHTAMVVANMCRVRFAQCSAIGDTIEFPSGVVVR